MCPAEPPAEAVGLDELARLMFDDLAEATAALPPEERAEYEDATDSVVEARRSAENKEGLLRIN